MRWTPTQISEFLLCDAYHGRIDFEKGPVLPRRGIAGQGAGPKPDQADTVQALILLERAKQDARRTGCEIVGQRLALARRQQALHAVDRVAMEEHSIRLAGVHRDAMGAKEAALP